MKVLLYHNLIVDDGGLPKLIRDSEKGIALPDELVYNYEAIREAYANARDNLIKAYRQAGGTY
jgi:hypothetical protein